MSVGYDDVLSYEKQYLSFVSYVKTSSCFSTILYMKYVPPSTNKSNPAFGCSPATELNNFAHMQEDESKHLMFPL